MLQVLITSLALFLACVAFIRSYLDHKHLIKSKLSLEKKVSDLDRILKFRGYLANEIAHEIKNPITAILSSAETLDLILADKLDESHRLTLRYIKEFGDSLHKLVSDFLDLNRAEEGYLNSKPQLVNLSETVKSVMGLLAAVAVRKGITLNPLPEGQETYVICDPVHLKQILFNLIHNAVKFTGSSGEISIKAASSDDNKYIKITVSDTGQGIEPEKLKTLFDPYVKYENNIPETLIISESGASLKGAGLGLALCKSLIENAGGEISVQSVPGKGTEFTFTMKAGQKAEQESKFLPQSFQGHSQADL